MSSGTSCSDSSVGPDQNAVAGVSIFTLKFSILVGATHQLEGRAVTYAGNRVDSQVTWKTSNAAIVTVSSTGLVTGIADGSAVITATAGSFFDTVTISVTTTPGDGT